MTKPLAAGLVSPPALLSAEHDLSQFSSGEIVLDDWLKSRAFENLQNAASRTYVLCPRESTTVIAFASLSMGQILSQDVVGAMRRNMPRNIPAIVLGRLAVDKNWQNRGLARALLADVVARSLRASKDVAARLLIVHALSLQAERFYLYHGFVRLPVEAPTLALDLVKYEKLAGQMEPR